MWCKHEKTCQSGKGVWCTGCDEKNPCNGQERQDTGVRLSDLLCDAVTGDFTQASFFIRNYRNKASCILNEAIK